MKNFDFVLYYGEECDQMQPAKVFGSDLMQSLDNVIDIAREFVHKDPILVVYIPGDRPTKELSKLGFPPAGVDDFQAFPIKYED